jgi:hypothetical protein
VAPLVLAVLLASLGVRRSPLAAVLLTGAVFAWVKATAAGSDLASATWSAVAGTSYIRNDPTDLLALPALLVALRLHRLARRSRPPLRQRALASTGALVLPFAVLASAATSPCDDGVRFPSVSVMDGLWEQGVSGWSSGQRFVVSGQYRLRPTTTGLDVRLLSEQERRRVDPDSAFEVALDGRAEAACDPQRPRLCWRTDDPDRGFGAPDPAPVAFLAVHESADGGETWTEQPVVGSDEVQRLRDEAGEVCGEPLQLSLSHVAVMSTEVGPVVVVTTNNAGLLVRGADGDWMRYSDAEIRDRAGATPRDPAPRTTLPRWEDKHPLRYVAVVAPVDPDATPTPSPTPPRPTPSPPCDDPTLVTVTPDPRNGPASTQQRCPVTS